MTCVTPIVTPWPRSSPDRSPRRSRAGAALSRREDTGRDLLGQEVRRRDLVPALVLHLMRDEPVYGNRIMKGIEELTEGVLSVNPNTIYPLLRSLEERALIEGAWEHPDRRTRRFYSITEPALPSSSACARASSRSSSRRSAR